MSNKKALSPLVATILLVVFALIIGTATMSWGRDYVDKINNTQADNQVSSLVISIKELNENPLKDLQIDYITNKISLDEYLEKEPEAIKEARLNS